MDPSTILEGWLLALRDLCDQGATAARVTLPGDTGDVSVYYSPAKGGRVITNAGTLDVPVEALDRVSLVPVEPDVPESLRGLVAAGVFEVEPAPALHEEHRP